MPKYVIVGNWTQEGVKKVKESPKRLDSAREQLKSLGGEIKEFYYTLGRYDFVITCKAPSNEVITKWLLMVASLGAVRTETLPATPAEKMANIIKELP